MGGNRISEDTKQRAEHMLRTTSLTQRDIASICGISPSSVSRINTSTVQRPWVLSYASSNNSFGSLVFESKPDSFSHCVSNTESLFKPFDTSSTKNSFSATIKTDDHDYREKLVSLN